MSLPRPRASQGASFELGGGRNLYIGPGLVKGAPPVLALNDWDGEQYILANFHNSTSAERLIDAFVSIAEEAGLGNEEPTHERIEE